MACKYSLKQNVSLMLLSQDVKEIVALTEIFNKDIVQDHIIFFKTFNLWTLDHMGKSDDKLVKSCLYILYTNTLYKNLFTDYKMTIF